MDARRDEALTDTARARLLASNRVAALPQFTWEELDVFANGLEALGELGILRDTETPFEPLVVHSLITAVREAQIEIEHALLVVPDLGEYRERRRGLRRRADRRLDLENAILGTEELDEHDREALMALFKALARRPKAQAVTS